MHQHEDDLVNLAIKYHSDKWNSHWYARHYHKYFQKYRMRKMNLLEIGVGGYDDPKAGGDSIKMWLEYFPFATIFAIDLYDKSNLSSERVRIFQGSQDDAEFLKMVHGQAKGGFDLIIDDGSHICAHVIKSFEVLFPLLNNKGLYAVEDTQTSYWPATGGDSQNLSREDTTTGFFKRLTDCVNHVEFDCPGYKPTYYDKNIVGLHFYHSLIIVEKERNEELSNVMINNTVPS